MGPGPADLRDRHDVFMAGIVIGEVTKSLTLNLEGLGVTHSQNTNVTLKDVLDP